VERLLKTWLKNLRPGSPRLWLKAQTDQAFDPEKLKIEIFDYDLPNDDTIRLAEPSYYGRGEFGFTDVNVQGHYAIFPDGSRHDIEMNDD
jgi:hypothetical protein